MRRQRGQVAHLARVGRQVVEFVNVVPVAHVLPVSFTQHHVRGELLRRQDRILAGDLRQLRQHGARRRLRAAAQGVRDGVPVQRRGNGRPGQLQERRHQVHAADRAAHLVAGRQTRRPRQDTGYPHRLLVHQALLHEAVVAEHLAVIAAEHHHGIVGQSELLQMAEQPPHLGIDVGDQGVVVREHAPIGAVVERAGRNAELGIVLVARLAGQRVVAGRRQRHLRFRVAREQLRHDHHLRMRILDAAQQEERRASQVVEQLDGAVHGPGGALLARIGDGAERQRVGSVALHLGSAAAVRVGNSAIGEIAHQRIVGIAVVAVGNPAGFEAVLRVFVVAEVPHAGVGAAVTLGGEHVGDGHHILAHAAAGLAGAPRAVVDPLPGGVRIEAAQPTRPRRRTHRRGAVGVAQHHPAARQGVDVGGVHIAAAGTPECIPAQLVAHHPENVGPPLGGLRLHVEHLLPAAAGRRTFRPALPSLATVDRCYWHR